MTDLEQKAREWATKLKVLEYALTSGGDEFEPFEKWWRRARPQMQKFIAAVLEAGHAAALEGLPDKCLNDIGLQLVDSPWTKWPCSETVHHRLCPQSWRKGGPTDD